MAERDKKKPKELSEERKEAPEKEGTEESSGRNFGSLSSPEGVLMMLAAIILDCFGLFFLIFGLDDFGIADVFGIFLIGGWMYSRSGIIAMPKGTEKKAKGWLRKLFRGKGKWAKYLVPTIGELIPYFGGIAFCWTLAVYYELTD